MNEWTAWGAPNRDGRWYHRISASKQRLQIVENCPNPHQIRLVEDEAGPYWGWLTTGADLPEMIQPTRHQFVTQFPYGTDVMEAAGVGRAVRLRIERLHAGHHARG